MKKLSRTIAIQAMCHQCTGMYVDGKQDCEVYSCPLYTWMPYRKAEPELNWLDFNPKRSGKVTWAESQRTMSEEDREATRKRLQKAREKVRTKSE